MSYIDDCVESLIAASQSDKSWGQIFFAASDEQCTVAEISEAIVKAIGGRVKFVPWPQERQAIEIGDAIITNRKIKSALGWSPEWNLSKGLVATDAYFRPNLANYLR